MKTKKRPKAKVKGPYAGITLGFEEPRKVAKEHLPLGMQETSEVPKSQVRKKRAPKNTFTEMETGQPDADRVPDEDNPEGVQGGRGPLNQEGEGERQNDQLAALEQIEPEDSEVSASTTGRMKIPLGEIK